MIEYYLMETFAEWLEQELNKRGWRPADLARQADIPDATLSRILNNTRGAGPDACNAIASALGYPPVLVFRKARLLPPEEDLSPEEQEAAHIVGRLDPFSRATVMSMLRGLDQYRAGIRSTATGYDLAPAADTQPQKRGATLRENERPVYDDDIPALRRLLASILVSILEHLPPDDVTTVYDTMKRYRDQRDSRGAAESVPRQP